MNPLIEGEKLFYTIYIHANMMRTNARIFGSAKVCLHTLHCDMEERESLETFESK